MFLNTY